MPRRHKHECACGDFWMCSQEPDHCPITHWDCPTCEDRARDDYFSHLDHDRSHAQEQEHAHEGQ